MRPPFADAYRVRGGPAIKYLEIINYTRRAACTRRAAPPAFILFAFFHRARASVASASRVGNARDNNTDTSGDTFSFYGGVNSAGG